MATKRDISKTSLGGPGPLFGGGFHFMGRGDFYGLILHLLDEKPMHGYEIIKAVEERFRGFYKPSAGAIYPALRSLTRKGFIAAEGTTRPKTYRVTRTGKAHLRSRRAEIEKRFRAFESAVGPERAALFREFRETRKILGPNLWHLTPQQARALRTLIVRTRKEMLEILSE